MTDDALRRAYGAYLAACRAQGLTPKPYDRWRHSPSEIVWTQVDAYYQRIADERPASKPPVVVKAMTRRWWERERGERTGD